MRPSILAFARTRNPACSVPQAGVQPKSPFPFKSRAPPFAEESLLYDEDTCSLWEQCRDTGDAAAQWLVKPVTVPRPRLCEEEVSHTSLLFQNKIQGNPNMH